MHWLGVKASDKYEDARNVYNSQRNVYEADTKDLREYLAKTEADHDRAAMIFGLFAMTVPFMIVGVLVSIWLLFF